MQCPAIAELRRDDILWLITATKRRDEHYYLSVIQNENPQSELNRNSIYLRIILVFNNGLFKRSFRKSSYIEIDVDCRYKPHAYMYVGISEHRI